MRQDARRQPKKRQRKAKPPKGWASIRLGKLSADVAPQSVPVRCRFVRFRALKRDTTGLVYADRCGQQLSEGQLAWMAQHNWVMP